MTRLIESLESSVGLMWATAPDEPATGNVITISQVRAANAKGWRVFEKGKTDEYVGSAGDANGDDGIDEADIDCLRDYILGLNPSSFSFEGADMNGDGTIDIVDLTKLIEMLK